MKLYYLPPSSYCQKVMIAAAEKGVEYESELVNLFDPEEAASYREIYPIGKIPILMLEDDHMISEASIIIEYLDTHFDNGPRLIPTDPDDSRKVRYYDRMTDLYLNDSVGALFFEERKPEEEQDQVRIQQWKEKANICLGYMESVLGEPGQEWFYGDNFSLADISAVTALNIAHLSLPMEEYPSVQAYMTRLRERPSIAATFAAAQPYFDQFDAS